MAVQTQAQVRASLIDSLDNIGSSRDDYEDSDVFSAGEVAVADFISRVQDNINGADMILTGEISDLGLEIVGDEIHVLGNDYLLYQDRGVKGSIDGSKAPNSPHKYTDKMPPLQVFIDYVKRKNINLANQAQFFEGESPFADLTEDEKIKRTAQYLQVMTFRYGFKPRNIFAKEIPQLKEDLKNSIRDFGKNAIKEVFNFKK